MESAQLTVRQRWVALKDTGKELIEMGETIITWNWPNWITVGLMAALFLALAGFAVQAYTKATGAAPAPTGS